MLPQHNRLVQGPLSSSVKYLWWQHFCRLGGHGLAWFVNRCCIASKQDIMIGYWSTCLFMELRMPQLKVHETPVLSNVSPAASGPGGRLRHNIQGAYEALGRRCRAPTANGLSSTKAILSLMSVLQSALFASVSPLLPVFNHQGP